VTRAGKSRVRDMIANIRRGLPDLPIRDRKPGEDAETADVEELGDLLKAMVAILPAAGQ
jgi:hypothetical protein